MLDILNETNKSIWTLNHLTIFYTMVTLVKPFITSTPFLYPLKASENLTVFWCFQGIEKGCIGNGLGHNWVQEWLKDGFQITMTPKYCPVFKKRQIDQAVLFLLQNLFNLNISLTTALTRFMPLVSFCTPWNCKKTFFIFFQGL